MRNAALVLMSSIAGWIACSIACSSGSQQAAPAPPPVPIVTIDAVEPAPPPPPDAAPPPDAPPPPRATSSDPSACKTDGDCVVHCPSAPGCCSSAPCGCLGAVARGHEADDDAAYARSCARVPHCPAVDCRDDEAMSAACEHGHCVARTGPESIVAPPP